MSGLSKTQLGVFPLGWGTDRLHIAGMKVLLTAMIFALLVGCNSFKGDAPPLVGTMRSDNPQAAILLARAKEFEAKGEGKKAIKEYRKLVYGFPTDKRTAEARLQGARILSAMGEEQKSFDAYQKFIEHHPGSPLYAQAIGKQEELAHAAASGSIRTSFLGLKSRLDRCLLYTSPSPRDRG